MKIQRVERFVLYPGDEVTVETPTRRLLFEVRNVPPYDPEPEPTTIHVKDDTVTGEQT